MDFTSALPSHLLLSLDSNLFIYNYATLALSSYSELSSTITAFATLLPLPIFTAEITSILVIATVDSIHIIGLSYSNSEITFYQTGLEIGITTTIVALKGTNDGRIFALDQAGDLYQLNYQSTEGWFTKRLSLQNLTQRANYTNPLLPTFLSALAQSSESERIIDFVLDLERGLIYTLLKNHSIEMYSLPPNGKPVLLCTLKDILQKSMGQLPQLPMLNARNFEIISLSPISLLESASLGNGTEKLCLVVTTSLGVRIFLTHLRRTYYSQPNSNNYNSLEIAMIKAPPTGANTSGLGENGMIALNSMSRAVIGEGGFFIGANSGMEDNGLEEEDLLACIGPDFGRISRSIGSGIVNVTIGGKSERVCLMKIPGRTWSIKPLPISLPGPVKITNPTSSKWKLNELATQVLTAPLRFLILTNMGIHLVARRRVIDGLVDILGRISVSGGGGDGGLGEVEVFFEE